MVAERKLVTAEDVWNMGEDAHVEVIRGELRELPAAGGRHGQVGGQFCGYLGSYGEHGRTGRVFTSATGLVIEQTPTTLLVPDLVYFKFEHLPGGTAPIGFFDIPPDAVLEVLSPPRRFGEMMVKAAAYLKFGVPLIWIANPDNKTVAAFYEDHIRVYHSGDMLDGGEVLPGFTAPVDDLLL